MRGERGFATAVLLVLLALVALFCLAVADAANVLVTAVRARGAADAAALAAATAQWPFLGADEEPTEAAARVAEANGAELVSCDCPLRGDRATVVVAVPTRVRMLGVAPPEVRGRASAEVDPAVLFRPMGKGWIRAG